MFTVRMTRDAKTALEAQFALMELERPAVFIYRQPSAADVSRLPNGSARWDVRHSSKYVVRFLDLPAGDNLPTPFVEFDGVRFISGPMYGPNLNSVISISCESGKLFVEDFVEGNESRPARVTHDGMELGLLKHGEVYSPSGAFRLQMLCIADGEGFDFHSLRLDGPGASGSHKPKIITRKAFQGTHRFSRWVAGLHSVQDDGQIAILRIGESSQPIGTFSSATMNYSWRSWNLESNTEVRRLKDCSNPFEPLE